jgi:hypothetical protein
VSGAAVPATLEWVKDVGLPIGGFVIGFAVSRFTLTKKDRADVDQKNYENTATLIERHDGAYNDYAKALTTYADAPAASLDTFAEIATKGDRYFVQLNFLASSVLSAKVDPAARDQILLPKIRAAVRRTLPQHYDALREMATKHGFPYRGELRRTDYAALYDALEKFGPGPEWGDNLDP